MTFRFNPAIKALPLAGAPGAPQEAEGRSGSTKDAAAASSESLEISVSATL